eukprot:g26603.t1
MGVNGFKMDVGGELVTGDGDRDVQEREGGVRNGPDEFEGRVESVGEIDELFEFLVLGARELKVLEKVETMGYVGGEFQDRRGKNRVEVGGDELSGTGAVKDNGSTGAVGFMDFGGGVRIEEKVGGGVGELASGLSDVE